MIPLKALLEKSLYNLHDAINFSQEEIEKSKQISERLPDEIIDAHAHCTLSSHVIGIDDRAFNHILSSFPFFSLDDSVSANKMLFPETIVHSLRFGMVFRGVDYLAMNRYLVEESPKSDRVALFGVSDDEDYTVQELETGKYVALKMYYLYNYPTATMIQEVFTPKILNVVEKMGIPVIVHLPKMITYSINEIVDLKQKYPKLKVTVCHLGSSEQDAPNLEESFYRFAEETDFMMDTSMNHRTDSIRLAFQTLGPSRIMFGTDSPINLLRSVPFLHPLKGGRIVTERLFHWTDKDEYDEFCHLARGSIHAHWQVVNNLLDVIELDFSNSIMAVNHQVFRTNASEFYNFQN